ncbi:hypothetical protein FB554_0515 [Barrientosiimonas humi]|uniref:Uncharacterized protein n=2 Tax=Barrientosiimonas TaxID=1535207 RepID=A0A542X979_9MICO|nr:MULTISPECIES: hypothetical protein [Barrientosiimonas]TQL32391.1 hypothetical protein FB554_0515 [Barrientosiimonas humi]BDZ57144.1 hypothetical protein GCM10025872_08010 [Barrientosiimonas endolithica]CAG7572382.1 hypothetical protein BH39T_PBIAJDOK_00996 [Barrientosiimonas humi]
MDNAITMTKQLPHGIAAASLRAAQPILRDLPLAAQGTRVSACGAIGVAQRGGVFMGGYDALIEGSVRPKGDDAAFVSTIPTFADRVGRSAPRRAPV